MDTEKILNQIVRVGVVTDVNNTKRMARVKFPDMDDSSGWLYVLAARPYIPDYDTKPQRTEFTAGGSDKEAFENHVHNLTIKPWMPRVNATVLTLFLPVFNADGFILGEIGPLGQIKQ